MRIMDPRLMSPWRRRYQQAWFRGATFHVETDTRASGRRVALHKYPKRNVPYAEDMGRAAIVFSVQGYLIGPNYLDDKDILIGCLEQDGPGVLRLPMPYQGSDITVMVQSYSVSESREKGGYCQIDMSFVEYGDPNYRANVSTSSQIEAAATNVETSVMGTPSATSQAAAQPYSNVYTNANVPNSVPNLPG